MSYLKNKSYDGIIYDSIEKHVLPALRATHSVSDFENDEVWSRISITDIDDDYKSPDDSE